MTLTREHHEALAAAQGETEAYLKAQRAIIDANGNAFWVEPRAQRMWGLTAGRKPGFETCAYAAPHTVAMWEQLDAHRTALAEAEQAIRKWGSRTSEALNLRWEDRDTLTALADRLAAVARVGGGEVTAREIAGHLDGAREYTLAELQRLVAMWIEDHGPAATFYHGEVFPVGADEAEAA